MNAVHVLLFHWVNFVIKHTHIHDMNNAVLIVSKVSCCRLYYGATSEVEQHVFSGRVSCRQQLDF